jgi:hypothetical protein
VQVYVTFVGGCAGVRGYGGEEVRAFGQGRAEEEVREDCAVETGLERAG